MWHKTWKPEIGACRIGNGLCEFGIIVEFTSSIKSCWMSWKLAIYLSGQEAPECLCQCSSHPDLRLILTWRCGHWWIWRTSCAIITESPLFLWFEKASSCVTLLDSCLDNTSLVNTFRWELVASFRVCHTKFTEYVFTATQIWDNAENIYRQFDQAMAATCFQSVASAPDKDKVYVISLYVWWVVCECPYITDNAPCSHTASSLLKKYGLLQIFRSQIILEIIWECF